MPRYRRYFDNCQTVFLTVVTADRLPWMASSRARTHVLEALRRARFLHPFTHHGHVLLEDHLHLLLSPHPGTVVPRLVGSFKRAAIALLPSATAVAGGRLWQRRYYDHVIRNTDDFTRNLAYIHFNPLKHRLAKSAGECRWSSFHAWRRRGAYANDWGTREPGHIVGMTE